MTTYSSKRRYHVLASSLIAMLLLALAPQAFAQDEEPGDDYGTIEEVIVTGTAGGGELRKFDASFSITTTSNAEINKFAPKSTADLFKLVPGVWAESSGGVSGANIFVRGFAAAGDANYVTVQVNGAPIFPPPSLSFLENSTMFRLDETVLRMEALRGGPNPVFSTGQPGVTTNFILREGSADTEGLVKFSTSDYDLRRFDGYLSGEIADEFYYMIGGYITSSPGIRDSGFNSDEGQQFTINLTKDLEQGSVNVFHRNTDDSGTWYLPVALIPGVDNKYNQIGTMNRQRGIFVGPDNTPQTLNFGEGRGWDGSITGASIVLDVTDNWQLTNRASYTSGNADTLGLVPDGSAINVGDLLADPTADPIAVVIGPIEGSVSGRSIGSSEYIQRFGAWEVRKGLEAFVNDLSLQRGWDGGTVTIGYYAANSSADDLWALGNTRYEVVQTGGEVVTGIACNDPALDGCSGAGFDLDQTGDSTTNAFYAAGTFYASDKLTVDVGVRVENQTVEMTADFGRDGQVGLSISADDTETSWTAAANYQFTDTFGAFLRLNHGNKMPIFNDYRDNSAAFFDGNNLIREVEQIEVGAKWVTDYLSVYATAFLTTEDPSIFVAMAGSTPGVISKTQATGVEIDANWATDVGFNLNLNATFQDGTFDAGPNSGNKVPRQPDYQLRLSPSYDFDIGADVEASVYGTLTAVDDRFSDSGNTVVLDGYEKFDIGVLLRVNEYLTFQLAADNITDENGITEGDPRDPTSANGRFIMPASYRFTVGYEF